jgi:hypothetical protein
MREDMAKVLVERPRCIRGFKRGSKKGYQRDLQRGLRNPDLLAGRERIKARSGGHKSFNENLAPLRRYLNSQVGRPWAKIQSEISERVNPNNVVQKHILTHLHDYVVTNVVLIDGLPHYADRSWRFRGGAIVGRYKWYVCPKSGLLKRAPAEVKRPRKQRVRHWFATDRFCEQLPDGSWLIAEVKPLSEPKRPHELRSGYDARLKRRIEPCEANSLYGSAVCIVTFEIVGTSALRKYPIPVDVYRPAVQNIV